MNGRWMILMALLASAEGLEAQSDDQAARTAQKYQVEARVMVWAHASERDGAADQQGAVRDLFVRRARVSVQGRPTENVSFTVQFGQDNIGSKLLAPDGSVRIKDAYLTYRASDAVQITAGQFKVPFLRANLESGFTQLLVDRATLPSLRPAREGSRDLGVMTWGNLGALQYRVALFDGSDQESQNSTSSFRVSSRVAYNWFAREIGLAYTGAHLDGTRVLQLAFQTDVQNRRLDPRDESEFALRPRDYRAHAVEMFVEQPFAASGALTGEGAWLWRRDDYLETGVPRRRIGGYYVQPACLLPWRLGPGGVQVAIRREAWTIERGDVEARTTRTAVGATYLLARHTRKIQADYTRRHETRQIANDEFRLSLSVIF